MGIALHFMPFQLTKGFLGNLYFQITGKPVRDVHFVYTTVTTEMTMRL